MTNLNEIFSAIRSCGAQVSDGDLEAAMIRDEVELEASAIAIWAEGIVYAAKGEWTKAAPAVRKAAKASGY